MRVQSGKPETSSDAWAEGHGGGLACELQVTACALRLVHINVLKKWKDSAVGVSRKGKRTLQAAWLSQQGCESAGGFIMLPWSEIIQITSSHTCLDR